MKDAEFISKLTIKFFQSLSNNYKDNYDISRFGKLPFKNVIKEKFKDIIFKRFIIKKLLKRDTEVLINILENYHEDLIWFYNKLSDNESQKLLIDLICYRILGRRYVKLPLNNNSYWDSIAFVDQLADKKKVIHTDFLGWDLLLFDLRKISYDIFLYSTTGGVVADFKLEQYKYETLQKKTEAKTGDFVVDAGGCWGDTSLYFASKVGTSGKVFSFEFMPKNLEIFYKNISLNPHLRDRITVVNQPLWNIDDKITYCIDNGPGSAVSFEPQQDNMYQTKTITIDKFVKDNKVEKIDFIKMDIEGSEKYALSGAINTIKTFKPALAIAIYHSFEDFVKIPRWIDELNLGYKFYIGHYTIHFEETILFAVIE